MTSDNKTKTDEATEKTLKLSVQGMETGEDPDTGEQRYQVYLAPAVVSKELYESFMKAQLASDDDTVEVTLK